MNTEQLYEKIEAYLGRSMSREESAAFEQELSADQELQRELALHRRLHQELGKAEKARLRRQLKEIAAEFPTESPGKGWGGTRWFLALALAGLLAGLAWWLLPRIGGEKSAADIPVQPADSPAGQTAPADTTSLRPATEAPPENDKDKTTKPAAPEKPVANAFTPNERLEALLAAGPGESPYTFTADAGITPFSGGRYELVVAGLLRTRELPEDARFRIRVYDNRAVGFPAGAPVEEGLLKLVPVEEDEDIYAFGKLKNFTFRYTLKNRLRPGLYYYLIVPEKEATPLFAGKTALGQAQE